MKHLSIIAAVAIALAGCITITHPDGTVERRLDRDGAELALLALEMAVTAYNAYRADSGMDAQPDRLSTLLDNVERAERIYARWAELLDLPTVSVVDDAGALKLEGASHDTSR